jgi:hypothetical protein
LPIRNWYKPRSYLTTRVDGLAVERDELSVGENVGCVVGLSVERDELPELVGDALTPAEQRAEHEENPHVPAGPVKCSELFSSWLYWSKLT